MKGFFKFYGILMIVLFLGSMIFEVIYEIGLKPEDLAADAYIIVIDDSGSMETNDPEKKRAQAIRDIVADKPDDFEYAVYTFSGASNKVRDMTPKSKGIGPIPLQSYGGTSIGGTLRGILNDIETGSLKVKENTRVILLSDGYATDVNMFDLSFNKVLDGFVDADIAISTVGLGKELDVSLMEKIAKKTGGVYIQVDDAEMLSSAMIDASLYSADRSLIGIRGYCRTDVLHAIMRVVFLLLIGAAVNAIKITVGGESKNLQYIISCATSVVAAVSTEVTLEVLGFGEDATRIVLCVLLALFIVNKTVRIKGRKISVFDDSVFGGGDGSEYTLSGYSSIDKTKGINPDDIQSLGSDYTRRKK